MKAAPAQSLQSALKDLDRAFRNFIGGRAGFPRYKRKGDRDSFHLPGKADLGLPASVASS
jgi:putative transposase